MAVQAGLCLAWLETPEDTFCYDEAHLNMTKLIYFTDTILSCIKEQQTSITDMTKVNNYFTVNILILGSDETSTV